MYPCNCKYQLKSPHLFALLNCLNQVDKMIYMALILLFFVTVFAIKTKQWKVTNVMLVLIYILFTLPGKEIFLRAVLKRQIYEASLCFLDQIIDVLLEEAKTVIRIFTKTLYWIMYKIGKITARSMYEYNILARRSHIQTIASLLNNFQKHLKKNQNSKIQLNFTWLNIQ